RRQIITLDTVHPDERELTTHLATLLGADVLHVVVQSTDLVRDLQVVDVRYRLRPDGLPGAAEYTTRDVTASARAPHEAGAPARSWLAAPRDGVAPAGRR